MVAVIRRPFFSCWRPMVAATFIFRRGGHWSPFFSFQNFVRDSALDVPFFPAGDQWSPLHSFFVGAVIGRPFLVSKTSYRTAPSTSLLLPSFPFPHSNTLRQADRLALFINLLHLCRLCYPLFFVCDRRQNPNLTLFLSSLYCFQFRHFRLLHRLRKPYTFHLF